MSATHGSSRSSGARRAGWGAVVVAFAAAVLGGVWMFRTSTPPPVVDAASVQHGAGAKSESPGAVLSPLDSTAIPTWPAALQGTAAPRLPVDDQGHLAYSRDVRDFFDYFLTAQSQLAQGQLNALVLQQIKMQLDGRPAANEAVALWSHYRAYLDALTQLASTSPGGNVAPPLPGDAGGAITPASLSTMTAFVDQRTQLRRQYLAEWSVPFFGDEDQAMHVYLARLAIVTDKTLTDAEKRRRLQDLDQAMPPEQRAVEEQQKQQQQWLNTVDQLKQQNLSPEAMRTEVAKVKGPEFADRFVAQQQDQAWQATYDQYAAQRSQIEAQGLLPEDQQKQIAQLRAQFFPRQSDALRATGLDNIGQEKH